EIWSSNGRLGERVALQKSPHFLPVEARLVGAARQPSLPQSGDLEVEAPQPVEVAGTAIVAVMSPELQTERSLLPRKGSMPMHATPLRNVAQRSAVAVAGCSHPHHPLASEALAPVEGEAEEIEGCRTFGSRTISMRSLPVAIRPLER